MSAGWIGKAAALPVRQLHLAGGGILLIVGAAFWFYALRAPLTKLRAVRVEHASLAQLGGDPRLLAAQLAVLQSDSARLARAVGGGAAGPAAPLVLQLIADVSKLAARHGVTLRGTSPSAEQKTVVFEQYGIECDASGRYADLVAWMDAIEKARPNLAVDGFEMQAGEAPGQVNIKLRIAAYRPLGSIP
jgi:Tfp pilus assembly protein PilO